MRSLWFFVCNVIRFTEIVHFLSLLGCLLDNALVLRAELVVKRVQVELNSAEFLILRSQARLQAIDVLRYALLKVILLNRINLWVDLDLK